MAPRGATRRQRHAQRKEAATAIGDAVSTPAIDSTPDSFTISKQEEIVE